jgi:KDO2-lipid IV(A) lauroyltransferase
MRRRARATLLRGLVRSAGIVPEGWLRGALRPLCRAGFRGRYGLTVDANLAAALPGIERRAPLVAQRLRCSDGFKRDVADFVAEQGAHWIRLARGASPGTRDGEWIEQRVALDPSIARLDAVLAEGRGAIIVTAHLGDWELLSARLRRRGHAGAVVGRIRHADPSHRWLVDMRRAYGVETVPQDAPAREALAVLRRGEVLGLLTDLRVRQLHGRTLPFFDAPARVMTAPVALARAHGTPLVPVRCVRSAPGGPFVLSVEEPLELHPHLSKREAADDLLCRQNEVFERWILETPEQWAWHQRRFEPPARPR